jgi:hypothetical protein
MALNSTPITADEPNNVLQNFDDSTAGRAMMLYYACALTTSAATSYVLARDAGFSNPVLTATGTIDFDVTINKTTVFSGVSYLDAYVNTIIAGDGTGHIHARLYHWDGVTETAISADAVSAALGLGAHSLKLPLTVTLKRFKPGDILRLKITITPGGGGGSEHLYHDPSIAGNELKLWISTRVFD